MDQVADQEVLEIFGEGDARSLAGHVERIKNNVRYQTYFSWFTSWPSADTLSDAAWELLGSYISGNIYMEALTLTARDEIMLDEGKISALFGGLTASRSLKNVALVGQDFGPDGIRSMMPFLRNCPNLTNFHLGDNGNIDAECLDLLLESLAGSNVERLNFIECNIESLAALGRCTLSKLITLDLAQNRITDIPSQALVHQTLPELYKLNLAQNSITDIQPQALANFTHLGELDLSDNELGEGGFRAIANLLRKEDSRLMNLHLASTRMDDTDMTIIAGSLKCNTKLRFLHVMPNEFGLEGLVAFMKLLNDVSSIHATGNSNHTLASLVYALPTGSLREEFEEIQKHLLYSMRENSLSPYGGPTAAVGRNKILATLFNRDKRLELSRLQGIEPLSDHHLFSDIDPVYLPDVLAMMATTNDHSELYRMTVVVAPDLMSLVDRRSLLQGTKARNDARLAAIAAEQAALMATNTRIERELISMAAGSNLSGKKRGRD